MGSFFSYIIGLGASVMMPAIFTVLGICAFLAAPASDYMTGYTYACDGGWLAR